MAEITAGQYTGTPTGTNNKVMATSLIGAHTLEHVYGRSFLVLIPAIYTALGLAPIQAGLLDAVRQLSGGVTSVSGGFMVDMFQHRRGQVLTVSMLMLGLGYLFVSISPSYGLILIALALASAGSALWHPPALGLLAQRFPEKRGLFISMHRSAGNVGEVIGPLIVGGLLYFVSWRWIMGGGTPIILALAVVIYFILKNVGGPKAQHIPFAENFSAQFKSMRESFQGTGMWAIFAVSAVRGMGDRALLWVIPLYLAEELGMNGFWVGFHVAILAATAIPSGIVFGALSDRIGRRPVTVFIMGIATVLPLGIALSGSGPALTLSIAVFGLFLYSVNSLTQAAAIDVAHGKGLEGTFIGLMWGSNAFFGAISSIAAGALVEVFGWGSAFYFASALFTVGFLASLAMPATRGPLQRAR